MLSSKQLTFFEEEGYLVVDNLLDLKLEVQPLIDEYMTLLDSLCIIWQEQNLITESYSHLPFEQRLVKLYEQGCDYIRYMDISLPQSNVKANTHIHLGQAVFNLITSPNILSAIESIIGPEIYSNPIQHVRIKPPIKHLPKDASTLISKTAWHQDQGVATANADDSQVVTVWVAVTDATEENGCLQVVRGSHKNDLSLHCPQSSQLSIPEPLIDKNKVISAPVKKGGALFLNSKTQHSSLDNYSDSFRWSFDLRYNVIGQATGRDIFPGFVAKSKKHPETQLTSRDVWAQLWLDTKARLAGETIESLNRWDGTAELCA